MDLATYRLQRYRCLDHGTTTRQAGEDSCPKCNTTMAAIGAEVAAELPPGRLIVARCMHRDGVYLNRLGDQDPVAASDGFFPTSPEVKDALTNRWQIPSAPMVSRETKPSPPPPALAKVPTAAPSKPKRRKRRAAPTLED